MSFGIPVRNGVGLGLRLSTALSSGARGLRPAMLLNFIGTDTLDSRVTFTRSGNTATRTNSSGVIELVNANLPRFDYDPVTLAPKGLLIEEQRINLLLNSLIDGTSLSTQSVTVAAVAHTISFYGTGTITLTGASVATVTGTGAYPNRRTLTFTPIVGLLVCTVTGSVQYAQLEAGSFVTSFIPTAGAAVTRNADVAVMSGTNFSSWYNQTEGTFVAYTSSTAASARSLTASAGAVANQLYLQGAVATSIAFNVFTASAFVAQLGSLPASALKKVAGAYKVNDFAASVDGGAVATDTSGALATYDRLNLGANALGTGGFLNGHIRSITYYNTRLSNTTIQVLTI